MKAILRVESMTTARQPCNNHGKQTKILSPRAAAACSAAVQHSLAIVEDVSEPAEIQWVLVLNCGSSSVKFALVDPESGHREVTGIAERVGTHDVSVVISYKGEKYTAVPAQTNHAGVIEVIFAKLDELGAPQPIAVGHRVLHGGEKLYESCIATESVLRQVESCNDLGPLHNPPQLAGIEAAQRVLPDLPHVAVFDTAFHHTMPPKAFRYAVPAAWYTEHGVRRYGFHGTSHRYVSAKAAEMLGIQNDNPKLVVAHLGNGSSVSAVRNGECVDTSMGLTPLEGLVMGTRSGDIDPAVCQFVADHLGLNIHEITRILNHESGLLALSGVSNDMRAVVDAAALGNADAQLAVDVFCYRLAKYIASYVVPLGGLDALVFTGGIGENSSVIRAQVLRELRGLGFIEDEAANSRNGKDTNGQITALQSSVAIVVPTDEEVLIARDVITLL